MTALLYLNDMQKLEAETLVRRVEREETGVVLLLEETIFYPQGGGQPFDTGVIEYDAARFRVTQVRWRGEEVAHVGVFEQGELTEGDRVRCRVDPERRRLHTRLHSAGHVVDMAVERLGYDWRPGKGYHFPDGPYVEYSGTVTGEKEAVRLALEEAANGVVAEASPTRVATMTREELAKVVRFVPEYVSPDHPSRVVFYGSFGVPCGGTHVANVGEVGKVVIRKIKASGSMVRVSYGLG